MRFGFAQFGKSIRLNRLTAPCGRPLGARLKNDGANMVSFLFCRPANRRKANAHLAHLQAPTHKQILQLAKEPNFPHPQVEKLITIWYDINTFDYICQN